jgi:hypothetical protein
MKIERKKRQKKGPISSEKKIPNPRHCKRITIIRAFKIQPSVHGSVVNSDMNSKHVGLAPLVQANSIVTKRGRKKAKRTFILEWGEEKIKKLFLFFGGPFYLFFHSPKMDAYA